MVGIISYGAYIPIYRLDRSLIWLSWGGLPVAGESAIANFDEDSITMAVEAGNNCLQGIDRGQVDALFLASTTTPYKEKQCAAIVAEALDLKRGVRTAPVAPLVIPLARPRRRCTCELLNRRSARENVGQSGFQTLS